MKQAGGKTADLTFQSNGEVLNSDYDLKNGNNPYYQWGRKDPMLPGDGITAGIGKDKTCYPSSPEYKFKYGSEGLNTTDIKEYIRNPHKFNTRSEMDGVYYNLWSTDNDKTDANDDVVIKSVYDPSPVGYSLPASNAFTGFTTTGLETNNPVDFNTKGNFDKGWYFYTKPNKQGTTFLFSAIGLRYLDKGELQYTNKSGCYWSSGPYANMYGCFLDLGVSFVRQINCVLRSYAFSVRSAEEK